MNAPVQAARQWLRTLTVVATLAAVLAATAWFALWLSESTSVFPGPGEAALYRLTDSNGQSGLYAIHIARPAPLSLNPTGAGTFLRVEETALVDRNVRRRTTFYSENKEGLFLDGWVEPTGGFLFGSEIPLWWPGQDSANATRAGRTTWKWFFGPAIISSPLPYTTTVQHDEVITVPAGSPLQAHRLALTLQLAAGPIRGTVWYTGKTSIILPLASENRVLSSGGFERHELLSASFLPPPASTELPAEVRGRSGPVYLARGGPERRGITAGTLVADAQSAALSPQWRFTAPNDVTSPPLLAGDALIFGDREGVVWMLDALRGEVRWTFTIGQPIIAAPAVAGCIVYVAGGTRLYALTLREGLYLWSYEANDLIDASPLVVDGRLMFGSEDGLFYALDARNGSARWHFDAGSPIVGAAAGNHGVVSFGTTDGTFFALSPATGNLLWQADLDGSIRTNPTMVAGNLYVAVNGGSEGSRIVAMNAGDGTTLWQTHISGGISAALAVDESLYAGTSLGDLLALDRKTGDIRWQVRFKNNQPNAPLVLNDRVIFTTTSGLMIVLDKATGKEVMALPDLGPLGAAPVAGRDRLYLANRSRKLVAFRTEPAKPPQSLDFSLRWSRLLVHQEQNGFPKTGPVSWKGRPLLLLDNGDLLSIEPETGAQTRIAEIGGTAWQAPIVQDDIAYIGLFEREPGRGEIIAFDLAAQQVRWQVVLDEWLNSPIAVDSGRIFAYVITSESGKLLAYDASNGDPLWEAATPPGTATPMAFDGKVYLATGQIQAWDAANGQPLWVSESLLAGRQLAICEGDIFAGTASGATPGLVALDGAGGQVRWRGSDAVAFPFGKATCDEARGQILAGGLDGQIRAYDIRSGKVRWTHDTGEPLLYGLSVGEGVVYGVTERATLLALEATSGRLLARYTLPYAGPVHAPPLFAGNQVYLLDQLFLNALEIAHE